MAKLFNQAPPTPILNYKDNQVNYHSLGKTLFNDSTILAIPKVIYQHLIKYSGCIFKNIHEHLSYDDIAKLIYINNELGYCGCFKDKIYKDMPEGVKTNVDYLLGTEALKGTANDYLNNSNKDYLGYELIITGNTIVVILEESFLHNYKDKAQKVIFLKELFETSFNIIGEHAATTRPFFFELIEAL